MKYVLLVVAACIATTACRDSDEPKLTIEELARDAVAVVVAAPTGERTESYDEPVHTVSSLKVLRTFRGELPQLISLRQPGAREKPNSIPKATPLVESKRTYLLFLRVAEGLPQAWELVSAAAFEVDGSAAHRFGSPPKVPKTIDLTDLEAEIR